MRCARPSGSAAACDVACPDPELRERRHLAAGTDAASVMTGAAEQSLRAAVVLLYFIQLTAGTGTAAWGGSNVGGGGCGGMIEVRGFDQSATGLPFNLVMKLPTESSFLKIPFMFNLLHKVCVT